MLSPEDSKKLDEVLRLCRETVGLVREIKMGRKLLIWAFGVVTAAVTVYDFWKNFIGGPK